MKNHSLIFFREKFFCQNDIQNILQKVRGNTLEISTKMMRRMPKKIKPVFVEYAQNITLGYAKSLFLAQLICGFELVIFYRHYFEILPLKTILKSANFISLSLTTKIQKEIIFNLNLNCPNGKIECCNKNQILINGQHFGHKKICSHFLQSENCDVVLQELFFNGRFYFFEKMIKNNKKINILIKKIINFNKFNFVVLQKHDDVFLYNIGTGQKYFVKCTEKISVCLTRSHSGNFVLTVKFTLRNKDACLYIGKEKINVYADSLKQKILYLSQWFWCSKIYSKNKKLEYFFNKHLPKKILRNKIIGDQKTIEELEKNYFKIKRKFVVFKQNSVEFCKGNFGVLKLKFCGKTKTIKFLSGQQKIGIVGAEFWGVNSVDRKVFEKFDRFNVYS